MYFFDTYALFELIKANKEYKKYGNYPLKVSVLNIAELYWGLLKEIGKPKADEWLKRFKFDIIIIDYDLIISAVSFRYEHKKRDISLVDSVGYLLAKKYGLKFLTGDKEFKDISNVEFVK